LHIGDKAGHLSKVFENAGEHLHVIFSRGHKDDRVIGIKEGARTSGAPPKAVQISILRRFGKDGSEWINCKDKK
jgi:hypothetical protein